jgi:diaminopimelate decarboxylase
VIAAGGDPGKTVFSGVGKQADEIAFALKSNIYCLNVESVAELKLISQIATELAITAPVSLRINPDIDVTTHPYITTGLKANKFGIPFEEALDTYQLAHHLDHIAIKGIDCHIGSQITELAPFVDALKRCLSLVDQLAAQGIAICHVDIGGGLGVNYQQQSLPSVKQYITALIDPLQGRKLELIVEPGRAIAAQAGLLLTQVHSIKSNTDKHFAIVDGAMNDLLRPALYQSWHPVRPVVPNGTVESKLYDIVGPVCETGDFLAKDRELAIKAGDLIAIEAAGAYGFVMSSNYNSRCRAAEVMLDGQHIHLIRQRETWQQLIAGEQLLP